MSDFTTMRTAVSPTIRSGLLISRPRSADMPTAMKKRPTSSPLKGSTSASSWWRYSESATITPAMKAPSPIEKPMMCIARAAPVTSVSAAAVKSS